MSEPRDRVLRHVERDRLRAAASHDEREAASVREAIEQPPAGVRGRRRPVLALIEKQPGLLSAAQVHVVLDPDLGDRQRFRYAAGQHVDALFQPFQHARPRIVPRENTARVQHIGQRHHDGRHQSIHSLRERLHHQVVSVPIDDERRKQVGFAMNDAVRRRVERQRFAERDGRLDPPPHQRFVRGLVSV